MDNKQSKNYSSKFLLFLFIIVFISCCSSPEKDFEKASSQNTIEAYQKFLEKYPSGDQSDKGRAILAKVKKLANPLPDLYLGKDKLLNDINLLQPFTVTYYLYGGSKILTWSHEIKDEVFNDTFYYNISMGSVGKTNVIFQFILLQDKKETELGQGKFTVDSEYYTVYSGQIVPKHIEASTANKSIIFRIIGSGSNFGTTHNMNSYIKVFKSTKPISKDTLNKISNMLLWLSNNNKWGFDSDFFTQFKNQVDKVILNNLDAEWKLGWDLFKSEKAYVILWKDKTFSINEKSVEEAKKMGIEKSEAEFSIIE